MEETNGITNRVNEFNNLLEQLGDLNAKRSAGVIDQETYIELHARELAYMKALDVLGSGVEVSEDLFAEILEEMRGIASQPTQEEINAANIDYLMMIGGEV